MESSAIVVVADGIKATVTVNDNKPVVVATGGGGEAIATCGVGEAIAKCDVGDVATAETQKTKKLKNKNRIHVSHTKRPFFFYCNLAKRYIKQYNAVELSALGMAIPTLITIAESLKSNGVAVEKSISTSTVVSKLDGEDGRIVLKAQLAILLGKAEELEETAVPVAAA
ncbi:hypothetical protein D8674_017198 [Pyrus ussuriensis x Pyrus communis]|uniref:DNA/RNA-binding protein Alba-like domain-containing protein n=1 Tax=Pyrus ussuriensis x Pyrus communis TaxID=2448454 RepID=A0A5N5HD36_9ROSA|nr:hypothetical protein D8674_017198 [Pyrus ussuriensis x Pyrus communis]